MCSDNAQSRPYAVQLTDEALFGYSEVFPGSVYARIGELIDTLSVFPRYGEEYDPYCPAAKPPVPCRVFFCGNYGVYYVVDDEKRLVSVLAAEDERRDPLRRFGDRG